MKKIVSHTADVIEDHCLALGSLALGSGVANVVARLRTTDSIGARIDLVRLYARTMSAHEKVKK